MVKSVEAVTLESFSSIHNHILSVPTLQRQFVWRETNVIQLLRDIEQHRRQPQELGKMFLGTSMIYSKPTLIEAENEIIPTYYELSNSDPEEISRLATMAGFPEGETPELIENLESTRIRSDLIDGQQRVTVLSILCRVCEDIESLDEALRKRLKKLYWHHEKDEVRLEHTHPDDKHDFKQIIDNHSDWLGYEISYTEAKTELETAKEERDKFQSEEYAPASKELDEKRNDLEKLTLRAGETPSEEKQEEIDEFAAEVEELEEEFGNLQIQLEEFETPINEDGGLQQVFDEAKNTATVEWSNGNARFGQKLRDRDGKVVRDAAKNTFKMIYETIREWVDNCDTLEEFLIFMLEEVETIVVTISKSRQVHLVFRSLNSLGVKLTTSEKVKNDILSMGVLSSSNLAETKWQRLEEVLKNELQKNRQAVSEFLWFYIRSKGIRKAPSDTKKANTIGQESVYNVFNDPKTLQQKTRQSDPDIYEIGLYDKRCKVEENGIPVPSSDNLEDFLDELIEYARAYVKVLNPSSFWEANLEDFYLGEIVDLQSAFRRQVRPYFMAAYMKTLHLGEAEVGNFQKLIRCISVIVIRLMIGYKRLDGDDPKDLRPNDLEKFINDAIETVNKQEVGLAIETIEKKVKYEINQRMGIIEIDYQNDSPEQIEAKEAQIGDEDWGSHADRLFEEFLTDDLVLSSDPTSDKYEANNAKHLLRGIEGLNPWKTHGKTDLIQKYYSTDFYTVEHILPKSARREWTGGNEGAPRTGHWWREHVANGRANWPTETAEIGKLRFRLGNHILLESEVNKKAGTKTWSGRGWSIDPTAYQKSHNHVPPLAAAAGQPQWGKYHIYCHYQWEWPIDSGINRSGSYLKHVKDFCAKHRNEDFWTEDLLNARTEKLASKAKSLKGWKLW